MTKTSTIIALVVIGIIGCFVGVKSVSATQAVTDKGTGCFVRVGEGPDDSVLDAACVSHEVLKMDNDGNFEFYSCQDHGQLPNGTWRPSQPCQQSFETCYHFSF